MAATTVKKISRPPLRTFSANGAISTFTDGDYLLVTVDYNNDGRRVAQVQLAFADYAGLQAEWEAGTATTVLEAALDTWLGATGFGTDPLTTAQKAFVGYTPTEA